MTFPHHRSPIHAPGGRLRSPVRARALLVLAGLALVLSSCGVDAGDEAAPVTSGASSATTTAAPTTTEATTTTTEDDGPGGVGGVTGGDKSDKPDTTDGGRSGDPDSTGGLTVEEISQEFQDAGLPLEQADCVAEIVHDADLTKEEIDEFTQSEDADTPAGRVLTDAITECFGLGE
ncbi:MAG: hypothetical protein ACTHN0_18255 [Aquihabitans sp.]